MFDKVLIANRGAIACRILRTLKKMGIGSVCIYSEADATSRHVLEADEAICIGPAQASQSYLNIEAILRAAKESGAQAIHPGYGFLSENLQFVRACEASGVAFIGPGADHIEAFALKHTARAIAQRCGVPLLAGTGLLQGSEEAMREAERLGYPVMLKSSAGGGGIGMRVCHTADQLRDAYDSVVRMSMNSFGDGSVYLEKFIVHAKHIEVQIFGDGRSVLTLGARDCSAQRRHQKVLEETPVFGLAEATQRDLFRAAQLLGEAVRYRSAGTVEFLLDAATQAFSFLEVNTRLQVEHGVTEQVTGVDLVEMMILEAANELPDLETFRREPQGASIEARIYAEDPAKDFRPAPGLLTEVMFPGEELARVETWVESGTEITPYYDPMIAKIIVTAGDRPQAVEKLKAALEHTAIYGTETNLRYLRALAASPVWTDGAMTTGYLSTFSVARRAMEVLEAGTQTTVQDYPGRIGYWPVGVPPSGPMDSLAMRLANRLAGNPDTAPAVEMTGLGASFRFDADAIVAIAGADMRPTLDGVPVAMWSAFLVPAHSELRFGAAQGGGLRTYLAIQSGLDVATYLGSASTFMLGKFGGHAGRALRAGDVLHFAAKVDGAGSSTELATLDAARIPKYTREWQVAVLYGPHVSPEFFQERDMEMLFTTGWQVHYQSDRTGIRLIGPKPEWARKDGGEAGLHPSNIHDNAYAVGSIDFTGDMPILLGPDGPSLGGFVCPAVVVSAELWKLGQMAAGDTVRFYRVTESQARELEQRLENVVAGLPVESSDEPASTEAVSEPAILKTSSTGGATSPRATYRADGDKYLLIEYGDKVLDLALRFRVHLLEQKLREASLRGIVEVTPGVRSLQIHYDNRVLPRTALLETLDALDREIPANPNVTVPSRTVYMPLSWNDPATQLAQAKYVQSVRPDAPWCPDNIEFIRRINGLASLEDVHRIVYDASYLVLGLGDVYLGAPVATPLDPRHRLVTTKYNPARTWTPENAVGIGGAYMCVYGMEGPGGYQLVGRTVQVWNTYKSTKTFLPQFPWALRCFDKIRFYPVSSTELLTLRKQILHGAFDLRVEEDSFDLGQYESFLSSIREPVEAFRSMQRDAFQQERERWAAAGLLEPAASEDSAGMPTQGGDVPEGCEEVVSPMTASVFQVAVEPGQQLMAGEKLIVLDAMKTEIVVGAPRACVVEELRCAPGKVIYAGQVLAVVRPL
jgi:urea carboxylase